MILDHWLIIVVLILAMVITVATKKLTAPASVAAGVVGLLIYIGAGFVGIAILATFFSLGTASTSWQVRFKEQMNVAEKNKDGRTTGQVFANAGVAAVLGLLVWIYPEQVHVFRLMIAASLSAATADTLSSELGNIYGKKYYNILTLKKDKRGLDGVISLEGTLIGFAGSIVIAIVYSLGFGWSIDFMWIVVGGTVGNIADSILGATLERQNIIKNNLVNFLNTLAGAQTALLLYSL